MALIEIENLTRGFELGGETVLALDGVSLSIEAGEFVAIVGASGSGKSTLMNLIGLLDRPSAGAYRFDGVPVENLDDDARAGIRRERFGFIFQRYHLMSGLTAQGNVEVPAIYDRMTPAARTTRSGQLLQRLGLGERLNYRPNKMSGGQQQRVSIARALMNGGEVILADEPTGALDPTSGAAVMEILHELNAEGHTIIIVTHDMTIAGQARRVIEIHEGRVVADRATGTGEHTPCARQHKNDVRTGMLSGFSVAIGNAVEMAVASMVARPLRTLLTMLGIIIGVAAVAAVFAVGEGSRLRVMSHMDDLGASTLDIYPGRDWGDETAGTINTLVPADVAALELQPYIRAATPSIFANARARFGSVSANVAIRGIGARHFEVYNRKMVSGRIFGPQAVETASVEAVFDQQLARRMFGDDEPLGQVVMLDKVPVTVVGVVASLKSGGGELYAYLPYTSVATRFVGSGRLGRITVLFNDGVDTLFAERSIIDLLVHRHGKKDFYAFNSDQLRKAIERTTETVGHLISAVAIIALIIGGIGVMNIMLVSVTERTKEIGLRMAVGARASDIMLQFLVEATVICMAGAALGVALALSAGWLVGGADGAFPMIFSVHSIVFACLAATSVGLIFGYFPARNAARLDPIEALSRD